MCGKGVIIDRGWYIYGPCFEQGRWLEVNNTPITFRLKADEFTPEVDKICSELFPKFREFERKGKVLEEFLRHIYNKKCDKSEFQDFYITKHEMWCLTYNFKESLIDFMETDPLDVRQIARNYEKIFYDGKYEQLVHLNKKEIENITKFLDIQIESLNFVLEEQRQLPIIKDIFNVYVSTVLTGLSHLNYAETFESFNSKFKNDTKKKHITEGHRFLSRLKEENRRLSHEMFNLLYRQQT